jgi:uridine kinase
MKIAILIAGYLRGFYENIDKIKNNIIQNNECDIYIHITQDDLEDKYHNNKINIEKIQNELKPKILIISKNLKFNNDKIINNLLNQTYKYYWLNEERNKIMNIENIKYDIVFKLRPDVHMIDYINLSITDNIIYIPSDSKMELNKLESMNDRYICDIFAYGSSQLMNQYFNFYNNIHLLINTHGIVGEKLLYYYLNENNIQYKLIDINYIVILSLCNTIAITGDSGSGKTTMSNLFSELFKNCFTLECDRYHKWERTNLNWNNYTHLNPESNYLLKMEKDVFDLKIGNNIYQIDYDHKTGKFTDKKLINSSDNIIICGLHTLYLSDKIVNLKIYLDTDDNLKIPWKINRDIKQRGHSIEYILEQIEKRKNDFIKYIQPQRDNADIVVTFYTNKKFSLDTFIVNEQLPIHLKIGVKKYNNIFNDLPIIKTEYVNGFLFLYFTYNIDYSLLIKSFIKKYSCF